MLANPALVTAASCPQRMRAAQSCGIAAADEWRARADVMALNEQLALWTKAPPPNAAAMREALAPWLDNRDWLEAFMQRMLAALQADPLAALPYRMVQGRVTHGLVLLQAGHAEVTLNWIDAAQLAQARDSHVLFSSALSVLLVVRSSGLQVLAHSLKVDGAPHAAAAQPSILANGDILAIDCRRQTLSMISANADAVLLRFNLKLPSTAGQQAFGTDNGELIAVAMGDDSACRMLPLLQVARLAGAPARARDVLIPLARDRDRTLRWAAMRELLVADCDAAVPILQEMAEHDPDPGVRRAAATTIAMIVPQENDLCPA